ncbi:unnamed protein product, partial [Phaeothamnion confervicola]
GGAYAFADRNFLSGSTVGMISDICEQVRLRRERVLLPDRSRQAFSGQGYLSILTCNFRVAPAASRKKSRILASCCSYSRLFSAWEIQLRFSCRAYGRWPGS